MKKICDTAWLRLEIRKLCGASAGGIDKRRCFWCGERESETHLWLDCKKREVGDRGPWTTGGKKEWGTCMQEITYIWQKNRVEKYEYTFI
jgi:hypothetical protein